MLSHSYNNVNYCVARTPGNDKYFIKGLNAIVVVVVVVVVVDTVHQSVSFFRIVRWWSYNIGHLPLRT